MTDLSPLDLMQQMIAAVNEGRGEEALRLSDRLSAHAATTMFQNVGRSGEPEISLTGPAALLDATSPNAGILLLIAPTQHAYMLLKEWKLAALKGADICALAESIAPNTSATAGDFTQLADALEQGGEPVRALEATEAAVRHLKGAGKWDEFAAAYGQRIARLQRMVAADDAGPGQVDEKFWSDLRSVCVGHVQKMLRYFDAHGAGRMDFARPRFEMLVQDEVIDRVIAAARQLLVEHPEGVVMPSPVFVAGSWLVVVSVYPSAADEEFLAACPAGSFSELARQLRTFFHTLDQWPQLDFAHWALLVDPPSAGSVHLHTHWSLAHHLKWLEEADASQPIEAPPLITPESLLKADSTSLHMDLFRADVAAWRDSGQDKD